VVGGHSPPAFRRAVERGNGWFGFALDHERTKQSLAGIAAAQSRCDRPEELGVLEISVTPLVELSADEIKRFEDLGVSRLVLLTAGSWKGDEIVAFVERCGALL
jgi:alkanesulfonate monooxygenase SsuD/methylene tetrahydromethanopterin reductase-like flavin-dependent oxidoreductase (luciferase family)